MILLPAIDLMGGQVVRLEQGKAEKKTVYSDNPPEFARRWEEEGGNMLHVVDLDAAFTGEQVNLPLVEEIVKAVSIPVELGGGMRSGAMVSRALDCGVSRVVVGTRAAESIDFIGDLVEEFGSDRIVVGIDAKNGKVAVKGWTEAMDLEAGHLAQRVSAAGVGTIIYTDIATDGMLSGPNFTEIQSMIDVVGCNVIASGGVSAKSDVEKLAAIPGLEGVIIGKALYDGTLALGEIAHLGKK